MDNEITLSTFWTPELLAKLNAYKLQTKITGISTLEVFMKEIAETVPEIRFSTTDALQGDACKKCYFHKKHLELYDNFNDSNFNKAIINVNCEDSSACSKIDTALCELINDEDTDNGEMATTYYVKEDTNL